MLSCKEYVGVLLSEVEALRADNNRHKKAVLALTGENERLLREVKQLREDNKWVYEQWHKERKEWIGRYDELRAVVEAAKKYIKVNLGDEEEIIFKAFYELRAALKGLEGK